MERNNGMRPQDIAILLKLVQWKDRSWKKKDLAEALFISPAEVGHSLNRSQLAGLVDGEQKKLMKQSFIEFLFHGLSYVFPTRPGSITLGIPTAYSAPVLNQSIISGEPVVWPYAQGKVRGQGIEPLYKGAIDASLANEAFYELLCLCDILRIGRVREKTMAREILLKRLQ